MSLPTPKKKNCTAAAACMRGTAADFFTRCAIAAADVHVELSKVVVKLLMGPCMAIVRPCKVLVMFHGNVFGWSPGPWKALGGSWKVLQGRFLIRFLRETFAGSPRSHGRHRAGRHARPQRKTQHRRNMRHQHRRDETCRHDVEQLEIAW